MTTSHAAPPAALEWLALAALCLLCVGVQTTEGLASAGLALSLVVALAAAWPVRSRAAVRPWLPLGAFVGWCLVVPLAAGHPPTGAGLARVADWLGLWTVGACVALLRPRLRRALVVAAVVTLLVSVGCAALQSSGHWPDATRVSGLAWTRLPLGRVYEPVPGSPGRFMAGGLLFHRLRFAHVTGFVVVWLTALAIARRDLRLGAVALVGTAAVLVFPHARAAAGAVVLALAAVVWMLAPRRARVALGVAAAGVLLVATLVAPVRGRLLAFANERPDGDRAFLLRAGLRAVAAHPLAGVGLGRFHPGLFPEPAMPEAIRVHRGKSHDQFVTWAAEAGLSALLLFCAVLVSAFLRVDGTTPGGAAARGSVLLLALLCLLHDPLFHAEVSMAAVAAIGLGLATGARRSPGPAPDAGRDG